jgi:hypothetical protein
MDRVTRFAMGLILSGVLGTFFLSPAQAQGKKIPAGKGKHVKKTIASKPQKHKLRPGVDPATEARERIEQAVEMGRCQAKQDIRNGRLRLMADSLCYGYGAAILERDYKIEISNPYGCCATEEDMALVQAYNQEMEWAIAVRYGNSFIQDVCSRAAKALMGEPEKK